MKLPRPEIKKARIEIIPMIDAIFFLLVFFMMTSLSMVQLDSQKVNLPESATVAIKPEGPKVVVSITKEGALYVDRRQVPEAQILPLLTQKVKADPGVTVILNCDRDQHMAQFARVFDLVKQANPANVMLAATPKQPDQIPVQTPPEPAG